VNNEGWLTTERELNDRRAAMAAELQRVTAERDQMRDVIAVTERERDDARAHRERLNRELATMAREHNSLTGQLAAVTGERDKLRKQLADLSTSLDYAAGQWAANAMPHTHPARSGEYRKVMAECARDLRYALKANAPDAASDLARDRDLAARVRAVIAHYKDDQVNALTAFADIIDAAEDHERSRLKAP
jgi:septal ring factor EnvC (AmiA/AmiB activator)